jgi:hypothetical protein
VSKYRRLRVLKTSSSRSLRKRRVERGRWVSFDRAPHAADHADAAGDHDHRARQPDGHRPPRRLHHEVRGNGRKDQQHGEDAMGGKPVS